MNSIIGRYDFICEKSIETNNIELDYIQNIEKDNNLSIYIKGMQNIFKELDEKYKKRELALIKEDFKYFVELLKEDAYSKEELYTKNAEEGFFNIREQLYNLIPNFEVEYTVIAENKKDDDKLEWDFMYEIRKGGYCSENVRHYTANERGFLVMDHNSMPSFTEDSFFYDYSEDSKYNDYLNEIGYYSVSEKIEDYIFNVTHDRIGEVEYLGVVESNECRCLHMYVQIIGVREYI
ncbi:hypothetical protein [Methanosphaera sp.]|jgi:hypothetical protein|uniref:hypothetical protein n=1 Tax=Methanosphaera sp. TaxID=2666342 RepID=UPI003D90D345